MSRYRAVFFDAGDTLVYPHPSPAEIMAEACRAAGFDVSPAAIEAAETVVGPRMIERQARDGELYSISPDASRRFWTWVYEQVLAEIDAPVTLRPALAERFHEAFNTIDTWRLFADTVPALEALQHRRRTGTVLAIISNWEDWLERLLAHLDIDRYFDFTIVSAGVQLEKPDPAIFHAALDRAGVRPDEALHVGDSLHADAGGARNAGLTPVLIDRRGRYAARPEYVPAGVAVIRTLDELMPLLD